MGKTHGEAIESVRGLIGCEVVRMELIQGEDTDINGGLSPDWGKWLRKWETARRRLVHFIPIRLTILYLMHNTKVSNESLRLKSPFI